VTEITLGQVFNGDDANIDILGRIIAGGRLLPGAYDGGPSGDDTGPLTPPNSTSTELTLTAERAFWGFTIPLGWQLSGTHGFVIESGFNCDASGNPLSDYMTDSVEKATKYCYAPTNKLYYLVAAQGDGEFCTGDGGCADIFFQLPPGLNQLDGNAYGKLTLSTLIEGYAWNPLIALCLTPELQHRSDVATRCPQTERLFTQLLTLFFTQSDQHISSK